MRGWRGAGGGAARHSALLPPLLPARPPPFSTLPSAQHLPPQPLYLTPPPPALTHAHSPSRLALPPPPLHAQARPPPLPPPPSPPSDTTALQLTAFRPPPLDNPLDTPLPLCGLPLPPTAQHSPLPSSLPHLAVQHAHTPPPTPAPRAQSLLGSHKLTGALPPRNTPTRTSPLPLPFPVRALTAAFLFAGQLVLPPFSPLPSSPPPPYVRLCSLRGCLGKSEGQATNSRRRREM